MDRSLKAIAWVVILGGVILNPIVQGILVLHAISTPKFGAHLVPMELYEMIFGTLGAVTSGASLLVLMDIRQRLKFDHDIKGNF